MYVSSQNDAITKSNIGTFVDITSQTTNPNRYTFPSDGYFYVGTTDWASPNIISAQNNNSANYTVYKTSAPIINYVKKGMRAMIYAKSGDVTVRFYPFE